MLKAKISQIFKSIQGEGPYQSFVQVFVRFFGCNLTCSFCDTDLTSFVKMDVDQVLRSIFAYDEYHSVSLTGGEPLIHKNFVRELSLKLKKADKVVYLETNGTLPDALKKVIDFVDIIAMDFKLPSSAGGLSFWQEHERFLKIAKSKEVFIKVVISETAQRQDIDKTLQIIKRVKNDATVILQPVNPQEEFLRRKMQDFISICLDSGVKTKVVSQIHKKLGVM